MERNKNMITSILTQEQINKSIKLLKRIRSDEGELFTDCLDEEHGVKKYDYLKNCTVRFFEDGENAGVFSSMFFFGMFRIFIAFEKDTDKYSQELKDLILLAKEKNPGYSHDVSFIAGQTNLIEKMRRTIDFNSGFYASHEFVMDKENFKGFINDKNLEIKLFEADRVGDYALLLDNAMTFFTPPANFQSNTTDLAERVERVTSNAFYTFYKNNELVGLYWLDNDFYTIDIIAVAPEHQRKGYGRIILSHAIDNVLNVQKNHMAKLYCVDWNLQGFVFYKKFGMIQKGHTYSMGLAD